MGSLLVPLYAVTLFVKVESPILCPIENPSWSSANLPVGVRVP